MNRQTWLSLSLAACLGAPAVHAQVSLIADGTISGTYQDLSARTAAPLENGVAGNRLGGLGSGLAYAGGTTFIAVPDRGPNANAYNSAINDTVSYINRFQTLDLRLAPSDPGSAVPFALTPMLEATTLLYNRTPLNYGSGAGLGVGDGAPALNDRHHYYFTGRSDNFDPSQPSSDPFNARLDPESVRVSDDGRHVFISDEYGPYLYEFDRATGERVRVFKLPANLAVANPSPDKSVEIDDNSAGRLANKGMEGLAITPNGRMLVGALQSPLIQDGGKKAGYTRLVTIDIRTGATHEYAYPLTNIGSDSKPKYGTISDLVAVNDHEFLVDERDGHGFGDGTIATEKKVFRIDLAGARDVSKIIGAANLAPLAVNKTLFADLVSIFNDNGIEGWNIPSKIEGLAFGPDVQVDGVTKHTLYVATDNDFLGEITDDYHPQPTSNPNHFYVFAFDASDLPGFVPQRIRPFPLKACRDRRDRHAHWERLEDYFGQR